MEAEKLIIMLRGLAEVLSPGSLGPITPARLAIYAQYLSDVPNENMVRAVNQAAITCNYFPTIAELRTFAGANRPASAVAEDAWALLNNVLHATSYLHSVRLPGPIAETVRRMGGWKAVYWRRNRNDDGNDWEPWGRKEFLEIFDAVQDRTWDEYLPGELEIESGLNKKNAIAAGYPERAVTYKFEVKDFTGMKALGEGK